MQLSVDREQAAAYGSVNVPHTQEGLPMRSRFRLIGDVVGCVALLFSSAGPLSAQDGPTLYKQLCASCHDAGLERAPDRDALRAMSPERVLAALESGVMLSMAIEPHRGGAPRHRRIRHRQIVRAAARARLHRRRPCAARRRVASQTRWPDRAGTGGA